jgi:succinoglycan biosynthesis transport protein ExoP
MEPTGRPARYLTLRDYLRVLRRYRLAIATIAILGAVVGYVTAKSRQPTYTATAVVAFQDPTQNVALVGLQPGYVQNPGVLAAQNAETLTRASVLAAAQRMLGGTESTQSLADAVSGQVSAAGLLMVNADASDPRVAARVANAVADAVVTVSNQQAKATFANAAADVRSRIAATKATPGAAGTGARLSVYEDELARLDTLSKFAQAAQLSQAATPPVHPTSPKTTRSLLIGLALGLLLGIAAAFLRDALDRRLRTVQEVESSFRFPILGHLRDRAVGRIAHSMIASDDALRVDLEASRIVRRNLEFLNLESPLRTIIVTSALSEAGKTTVASSLAFAMAAAGKRTLLVDCDLRRPALGARLGVQQVPGLIDYLLGHATPQQILRPIPFRERAGRNGAGTAPNGGGGARSGLVAIPAGSPTTNSAELLGSPRFREFLGQVAATYDVVVMDSSPMLPVADTLEMLPHVDAVVVCARESKTTREEAQAVKAVLSRFPKLAAGVVITGIKPSRGEDAVYAHSYASESAAPGVPSSS